jgi:hypothetical protein
MTIKKISVLLFSLCVFSFAGCDQFFQKKVEPEKKSSAIDSIENQKSTEDKKADKGGIHFDQTKHESVLKIVSFKESDVKIENGTLSLKLNIEMLDQDWFLYSFDNKAKIGKPLDVSFYFFDQDGEKHKINGDILKTSNTESLTVTKEAETIDSKEQIEIKVFPKNSELYIEMKSPEIKNDGQKIAMEISGAICQKEKSGMEPEICVLISDLMINLN